MLKSPVVILKINLHTHTNTIALRNTPHRARRADPSQPTRRRAAVAVESRVRQFGDHRSRGRGQTCHPCRRSPALGSSYTHRSGGRPRGGARTRTGTAAAAASASLKPNSSRNAFAAAIAVARLCGVSVEMSAPIFAQTKIYKSSERNGRGPLAVARVNRWNGNEPCRMQMRSLDT